MDVGDPPTLEFDIAGVAHRQRWELAAALAEGRRVLHLCCGSGEGTARLARDAASVTAVDRDADAVHAARQVCRDLANARFTASDPVRFLNSCAREDVDLVVCIDGLLSTEELADALWGLRRLTDDGVAFFGSIRNRMLLAEGDSADGSLDIDELHELVEPLGNVSVLHQFLAETALISPADPPDLHGRFAMEAPGEPEYASDFIVAVNLEQELAEVGTDARIQASVAPAPSRLLRNLERANRELWRTNTRLARQAHATFDSAAGALVLRRERLRSEAAQERDKLEEELLVTRRGLERLQRDHEALRRRKLVRLAFVISRLRSRLRI
jgi:SAM-dependent methyltransferase